MGVIALIMIAAWLVIVGGLRGFLLSRRTGHFGVHARDPIGSAQWWSKLASIVAVVAGVTGAVAAIAGLPPIAGVDAPVVAVVGVGFVVLGIAVTVASQLAMGDSWRGDVDPDARTALVTTGPFRYARNPILTSTFVVVLGIALTVPNVFALAMVVLTVIAQQIQVRLVEEPYLLRVHGDAYRRYAADTGRFVPWLGRLRSPGQP